jgi:hypothetical protein
MSKVKDATRAGPPTLISNGTTPPSSFLPTSARESSFLTFSAKANCPTAMVSDQHRPFEIPEIAKFADLALNF